jgi:hypothetical protein
MKPYVITRRIDWIRAQLAIGKPINATIIAGEHGIAIRTAARDMKYLKQFYRDRLKYDYREKSYYLD